MSFAVSTAASVPFAIRRYWRQILKQIGEVSFGYASLLAGGGTLGIVFAMSAVAGALIENLDRVTATFAERRETVESVAASMSQIGDAVTEQDLEIGDTISELTVLFDRIDALVTERGGDIGRVLADSRTVTDQFARHEGDFAEFMDLVPLLMQNIDRMITPDQRARIRLNVSTTLTQFEVAKPLCDRYVVPLCEGAGMTNPISVPISTSDPLGLATFMQGGR